MGKGLLWVVLYVLALMIPTVLLMCFFPGSDDGVVMEIGKNFGLFAFTILVLQVVLAARFKWLDRVYGLDMIIRFHRYMAVFALVLLVCHPILIAAGKSKWKLVTSLDLPWYVLLGKAALLFLLANVLLSLLQLRIGLKFEKWRCLHGVIGPLLLMVAFTHSYVIEDQLRAGPLKILWPLMLAGALALFVYHRFIGPANRKAHSFRVAEVKEEAADTWTVKLTRPANGEVEDYLPGQFHFLTFYRDPDLPVEEHHWTISSSPAEKGSLSSTIKASGDFTATIGRTKPGDTAGVQGPFGRFSYILHPEEKAFLFIAGGIGITPLMGMLRHMRDMGASKPVVLLYANRDEEHIVFKKELAEMQSAGRPPLQVVHVLSRPGKDWQGKTGHIDGTMLQQFRGDDSIVTGYYVCGPKSLQSLALETLKDLGVAESRIHTEVFSFLT